MVSGVAGESHPGSKDLGSWGMVRQGFACSLVAVGSVQYTIFSGVAGTVGWSYLGCFEA